MTAGSDVSRGSLLLAICLIVFKVLICGSMAVYVMADPGLEHAHRFLAAALRIHESYPTPLRTAQLFASAQRGIVERLDRYSDYVTSDEFEQIDQRHRGSYEGIGVTVVAHESGLMVMSVRENAPAAAAGILIGDVILAADSIPLAGMGLSTAADLLTGEEASSVVLDVYRQASSDTLRVEVIRRRIDYEHVAYAGFTADSIVYLRVLDFNGGATQDIEAALDSLGLTGAARAKGLILDLRNNPGGLLSEACHTADLFLPKGTFIVGTDGRSRWEDAEFVASEEDITDGLAMAVIVDSRSASSAEIVAGALQQAGRACLVGDTTFGKGLVQTYVRFLDQDGLKLTISRYYLEGRRYLNEFDSALNDVGCGLVPDYYVDCPEDHRFGLALENSLLLQRFAQGHERAIIASVDRRREDSLLEEFMVYAFSEGFQFESRTTESARQLSKLVRADGLPESIKGLSEEIIKTAERHDRREFYRHAEYIRRRLLQLAYARHFSTYYAYEQIVTRRSPIIRTAAELLTAEQNP